MSNVGKQLVDVIKDVEFKNITQEVLEVVIDEKLPESFLKEVPLLSMVLGAFNTIGNIKDRLFVKKLLAFLFQLKNIDEDELIDQIIKLEDDVKYRTKVGEKLLYIIDKCEDPDKASLTGLFFKAYLEKKIDYDDFLSGTSIIERTPLPDLLFFINDDTTEMDLDGGGSQYVSYGLMEISISAPKIKISREEPDFGEKYVPSEEEVLQHKMKIDDFSIRAVTTWLGDKMRKFLH